MILGYILICGMGAAQPNAVDGCMVTTRLFPNMELCKEGRQLFLNYSNLREGHYVEDSDCFRLGTKVLILRTGPKEKRHDSK
jgi:hypothetical protein